MNWAKTTNQKVAMFLINFEKAYDRVECRFLLMMLESFGFPKDLCKLEILLKDASAQIDVNGSRSQSITLSRYIRPGCP